MDIKIKFYIFSILYIILNFIIITKAWGYDHVLSQEELAENKNSAHKHFKNGFEPHTMRIGFRLKNSQHNEVEIFSLHSNNNKLALIYYKNEHKVIFRLNIDLKNMTTLWEVQYPNTNLEVGGWHFLVYRFGNLFFKTWVDCELKKSITKDLKALINMDEDVLNSFGKVILLQHGDNDDIEYNQQIKFLSPPHIGFSFDDRSLCRNVFNSTNPQVRINNNNTVGVFYPLSLFQEALTKYDYPGVYYEISKSTTRDVSEYFEDGLDKDHSFEITYRIKEFPISNISYYLITLRSGADSFISIALNGKRNMLKVQSGNYNNGDFINAYTEFWADQIFNHDWHTIKYILNDGIFTLWIDNEIMEDILGFKHIDFKYNGFDRQFVWFDTSLMILEPQSGFYTEPVLHLRHMKYYGNAITTNNTEISLASKEIEITGYFNSLFRVISRKSLAL